MNTNLRKSVLCVGLLACAISSYAQQPIHVGGMASLCSRQGSVPPRGVALPCKTVLSGLKTPASNDLPNHDDGATYISFDAPGAGAGSGQGTYPYSINVFGVVTGYDVDAAYGFHGFVRGPLGDITTFDIPGAVNGTYPAAINAEGTITGNWCDVNDACPGFVRSPLGTVTSFHAPGDVYGTVGVGINLLGAVTESLLTRTSTPTVCARPFRKHHHLRRARRPMDLPNIHRPRWYGDRGYADANGTHGFLRTWSGRITSFDVPGGRNTAQFPSGGGPNAAIDLGVVASNYFQPIQGNFFGGNYRGMIRKRDGTLETFDAATYPPCCIWTFAVGITPDETSVGWDNDGYDLYHGFIRTRDGSITLFDVPGAGTGRLQGTIPLAINAEKIIVGTYVDTSGVEHGFLRIPR